MDIRLYFASRCTWVDPDQHRLWMRIGNQLSRSGILTTNQLCETPVEQIKQVRNIGEKSLSVILEEREKLCRIKIDNIKNEEENEG